MIRLLALVLVGLAAWRLLARRAKPGPTVTVAWSDGTARRLDAGDPLTARILAVADRVAP